MINYVTVLFTSTDSIRTDPFVGVQKTATIPVIWTFATRITHVHKDVWMVYTDKTALYHVHRTAGILPVTERMEHVLKDVWMVYTDKTAL